MAIEREVISEKSQYVAIKNETYVQLARKLGIRHKHYSSANNTGNVMESLCWLAYEQKRYNFILSIVKFAADFEYPVTADAVAPGPSVCPVCLCLCFWPPAAPASSNYANDYSERRCMSTWTRGMQEDYARLNKHAMGRQEEMERKAAWLDLQAKNENAKRQERSNRGQTLEMLRRTTTVPDTNLPTYLQAYVSLCGTTGQQFHRRFRDLEERFDCPWHRLRTKMAYSVAEPKERNDEELDKAYARFKLAYKEACLQHFSKQNAKIMNRFIRDIFENKKGFMKYLSSGVLSESEWIHEVSELRYSFDFCAISAESEYLLRNFSPMYVRL